jgi:shikimate kinase
MGAGKTCVGRCLSEALGLPFIDADLEIEAAAGCSIEDFFELYGELEFREGEAKVIRRLLGNGPQILATGGGAFMSEQTRQAISETGISVWLNASLDILSKRTSRRGGRPLLNTGNPLATLKKLINLRYPVYGQADITIETGHESVHFTTEKVLNAVQNFIAAPGNAK